MHAPVDPSPGGVSPHPFAKPRTNRQTYEFLIRQMLRVGTYSVLLAVGLIFAHIIWKGLPVVAPAIQPKVTWVLAKIPIPYVVIDSNKPFINTNFLTKLPETLHVIEDKQGNIQETSPQGSDVIKKELGDNMRSEKTISYSGGGILGPIVGTALLVIVCMVVALFLGIASAIYLSEYASHGKFIEGVRLAILNLAGVPSVVFGLFGLGIFVLSAPVLTDTPHDRALFSLPFLGRLVSDGTELAWLSACPDWLDWLPKLFLFESISFQGWDTCVLSGAFTLAFVILPVIITASEECLRAVPQGFRETSLALGATRWQTIWRTVLPFAMPGILTSSILGIARAAGETAPIMFTAALAFKDKLPWEGDSGFFGVFTQSVQALPYHIYTIAARIPQSEYSERAQYGSVFVFLVLVLMFAITSVLLRRKLRAKYKW